MDHRIQQLVREIQRSGQVYALTMELIRGMRAVDIAKIHGLTSFYNDRATRSWTLMGHRFKVAELPDSTIERLINENQCIRRWRNYLQTGRRASGYDWDDNTNGTNVYEIILDEAEHRGILSGHQKIWRKMRDRPSAKLLNKHFKMAQRCTVRSKHEYIQVDENFKCIHCHGKVRRETITEQAHDMLRGRLKQFVC